MTVRVIVKENHEVEIHKDKAIIKIVPEDNYHGFKILAGYDEYAFEEVFRDYASEEGAYSGILGLFDGLIFTGREGDFAVVEAPEDIPLYDSSDALSMIIRGLDVDKFVLRADNLRIYLGVYSYMGEGRADWFRVDVYEGFNQLDRIDSRKRGEYA